MINDEVVELAERLTLKKVENAFVKQANGDYIFTEKAQEIFNNFLEELQKDV